MIEDEEFVFAPTHVTAVFEKGDDLVEEALTLACDFCLDRRVVWEYACPTFTIDAIGFGSEGNWLACERCAQLIEASDSAGLYRRSMRSWIRRVGAAPPDMGTSIDTIQTGFFKHYYGKRVAYVP